MLGGFIDLLVVAYGAAVLYALLHDGDSLPSAAVWPFQQIPVWLNKVDPNLSAQLAALEQQLVAGQSAVDAKLATFEASMLAKLQAMLSPPKPPPAT